MDLSYEEITTELDTNARIQDSKFYIDPKTGYKVIPTHVHEKRGKCCGNMCRHCPYGWVKVRYYDGKDDDRIRDWKRNRDIEVIFEK